MAEYVDASTRRADSLEAQATTFTQTGQSANDTGDRYVLHAVIFATVLFLAAIADHFTWRPARASVLVIGMAVLAFGVLGLTQLPIRQARYRPDPSRWDLPCAPTRTTSNLSKPMTKTWTGPVTCLRLGSSLPVWV